jgi:hypothetical protein
MPRPRAPNPLPGCSVYLRPDQWARLRRAAHLRNVSVSRLLRELLEEHLNEKQFVKPQGQDAPRVL